MMNTITITSLTTHAYTSRFGDAGLRGNTTNGWLAASSRTPSARTESAGTAFLSQLRTGTVTFAQGQRNAIHATSMAQAADTALMLIDSILDEALTLAQQAIGGGYPESEQGALQGQFDDLLDKIDAVSVVFGGVNLLTAGDPVTVTLAPGDGDSSPPITIQRGEVSAAALVLTGADLTDSDTVGRIEDAIGTVADFRSDLADSILRLGVASTALESAEAYSSAAESTISDADTAAQAAATTRRQLLGEAGMAMALQTEALSEMALDLLGVPMTTPLSETVLPWHVSTPV